MSSAALPAPMAEKISVQRAVTLGWLFINGPVTALMFGIPVMTLWLIKWTTLPGWSVLASFPAGFGLAWLWWSYATPKWRLWAMRRAKNLYLLHDEAVRAQLVWPHGSIFENTEFKSALDVLKEKHVEFLDLLDWFRFYLDYLEAKGGTFSGLDEPRRDVDECREALYRDGASQAHSATEKAAMDRLRLTLKSMHAPDITENWLKSLNKLEYMLDFYQELRGSHGSTRP